MLKQRNHHPRDDRLFFDEEPHIYYIDNDSSGVISVTTFVHKHFQAFDADTVIKNMRKGRKWNDKNKYFLMTDDEIKKSWDDNRIEASTAGTHMHKCIELFYNERDVHNDSPEYKMFLDFHRDHSHLKAYRTEWEVFLEEYKLAGSIDMVFENPDGTFSIYDWKRCKEIKRANYFGKGKFPIHHMDDCNYVHYTLQLNIYKYILETKYDIKIKDMFLVSLHPNQTSYIKHEVFDKKDAVEDMLLSLKGFAREEEDEDDP